MSSDACQESASERRNSAVARRLGKIVADFLKNYHQFSFILVLRRVNLVILEHGSPDMEFQRNKVWRIRWPLIFLDEVHLLVVQRAKFSASVMVLAGVHYGGKEWLYFVPEQAKINVDYYTNIPLPNGSKTVMMLCLLVVILQQD